MDCQRILKPVPNCPNCGAPIKGSTCEYCGTTFSVDTEALQSAKKIEELYSDAISAFKTYGDVINQYIDDDIRRLKQEIERRRFELEQAQFSQNIVSAIHAQNAFQQTNLVTSHRDIQFTSTYSFLF